MLLINSNTIFNNQEFKENEPAKDPIFICDKFKVMRISLKKGQVVEKHAGNHPVFFLVLKGRGVFLIDNEEIELGPNEFVSLTANEERGIKSIEDLVVLAVRD